MVCERFRTHCFLGRPRTDLEETTPDPRFYVEVEATRVSDGVDGEVESLLAVLTGPDRLLRLEL